MGKYLVETVKNTITIFTIACIAFLMDDPTSASMDSIKVEALAKQEEFIKFSERVRHDLEITRRQKAKLRNQIERFVVENCFCCCLWSK